MKRHPTPHTGWCARGHRCNLAEHRAHPITVDAAGNRATITRVQGPGGTGYADVTLAVRLDRHEPTARTQLGRLLTELEALLALVDELPWHPTALPPTGWHALNGRAT